MSRQFQIVNCKQSRMTVPLTIGLVAPSYGGKTCSAHRLAQGIKRVSGKGPIVFVDTEGGRALEFRDRFDFEHLAMAEPLGSLDYCAALDAALEAKPSVVVLDSLSHEHEGVGGYMDLARQELDNGKKEGQHWALPAGYRRRLVSRMLTFPCALIICMRAKPALDWKAVFTRKAKQPPEMGLCPIGGAEFVYQMTARFLLPPANPSDPLKGAPMLESEYPGEQDTIKLGPFASLFAAGRHQLCEADGEAMARWAQGAQRDRIAPSTKALLEALGAAQTSADVESLAAGIGDDTADRELIERAIAKRLSQVSR